MPGKLSDKMKVALGKLSERGDCSAYAARVPVSTMHSLQRRGFAIAVGQGHMAFPSNGSWRITDAGRAALALTEPKQ